MFSLSLSLCGFWLILIFVWSAILHLLIFCLHQYKREKGFGGGLHLKSSSTIGIFFLFLRSTWTLQPQIQDGSSGIWGFHCFQFSLGFAKKNFDLYIYIYICVCVCVCVCIFGNKLGKLWFIFLFLFFYPEKK